MQDTWMEKREERERSVITAETETERDGVLETAHLLGARQLRKQQEETPFAYKH